MRVPHPEKSDYKVHIVNTTDEIDDFTAETLDADLEKDEELDPNWSSVMSKILSNESYKALNARKGEFRGLPGCDLHSDRDTAPLMRTMDTRVATAIMWTLGLMKKRDGFMGSSQSGPPGFSNELTKEFGRLVQEFARDPTQWHPIVLSAEFKSKLHELATYYVEATQVGPRPSGLT